jgi:hypothetical protein
LKNLLKTSGLNLEYYFFKKKVENVSIKKRTLLKIPNYERLVEFGLIHKIAYKIHNFGRGFVHARFYISDVVLMLKNTLRYAAVLN